MYFDFFFFSWGVGGAGSYLCLRLYCKAIKLKDIPSALITDSDLMKRREILSENKITWCRCYTRSFGLRVFYVSHHALHLWLLVLSPWLSLFSVIFAVLHSFEKEHFYPWMFLCGSMLLYLLNCAIVIYSLKKKKKSDIPYRYVCVIQQKCRE